MQIKTSMEYKYTSIRMAKKIIFKRQSQVSAKMQSTWYIADGNVRCFFTFENNLVVSHKLKKNLPL